LIYTRAFLFPRNPSQLYALESNSRLYGSGRLRLESEGREIEVDYNVIGYEIAPEGEFEDDEWVVLSENQPSLWT
jgi:hypothetical protein